MGGMMGSMMRGRSGTMGAMAGYGGMMSGYASMMRSMEKGRGSMGPMGPDDVRHGDGAGCRDT